MAAVTADLLGIYKSLLKEFGLQHWWPAHRNFEPREWEVCAGAVLTQNASWRNVERALDNLKKDEVTSPSSTMKIGIPKLEELVRPSGFYRQKAIRLRTLAGFVLAFGSFDNFKKSVERSELLKVKGIGPETADSILLYACGRPHFVIDAYTRRFVSRFRMTTETDYDGLREYFEKKLPRDVGIYKEFHALIVEWGKRAKSKANTSKRSNEMG